MDGVTEGAVQPGDGGNVEGQGAPELDSNLFPGIDEVPAEYRQHIDPILQNINTNVNKHISSVNSKLKDWEPYENLGLRDKVDPETMEEVLGFLDMMASVENDPTEFKNWWETVGNELQFFEKPAEEEEFDPLAEGEENQFDPESLKQDIIESIKQEVLGPLAQKEEQQQQEQQLAEANQFVDKEIKAIKEKFGDFDESTEQRILTLSLSYGDDPENAIQKGFEDYKAIVEQAQGKLFAKKENQPGQAEGAGTPNTTPPSITTFDDATKAAKERIAQSNSS